jgi:hypothetical protein
MMVVSGVKRWIEVRIQFLHNPDKIETRILDHPPRCSATMSRPPARIVKLMTEILERIDSCETFKSDLEEIARELGQIDPPQAAEEPHNDGTTDMMGCRNPGAYEFTRHHPRDALVGFAETIAPELGVDPPCRTEKRTFQAMVHWFDRHWPRIEADPPDLQTALWHMPATTPGPPQNPGDPAS